jgi:hypothetical protein
LKNDKAKKSDPFTTEEIAQLNATIQEYEKVLDGAKDDIAMKGKQLDVALRENPSLSYFYGVRKAELSVLHKKVEARVYAIRGRLHRWFKENDSRTSSERQLDKYVDSHEEYLTAVEVLLWIEEVYKKYIEIETALEKRGFALRDFTSARIKEVYRDVI